jgi:hypothetical protein
MKDPFGNYLVQKLLEVCNESQRMEILRVVTMDGELVKISLNMHGYAFQGFSAPSQSQVRVLGLIRVDMSWRGLKLVCSYENGRRIVLRHSLFLLLF